jgi:histidinol phosphatase-like PHP family hydrolase
MEEQKKMPSRFDLHLHTKKYSPDSDITPEQMVYDALAAGLTGIVVTEHDLVWTDEDWPIIQAIPGAEKLTILKGIEISAYEGHFLCFGLEPPTSHFVGMKLRDILREIRHVDTVMIAAHPYRWDQEFDEIYAQNKEHLVALELASKNIFPDTRERVEQLIKKNPGQRLTASSDAHHEGQIGCYYTEFDDTITNTRELINALRGGNFRPRHNTVHTRWQISGPIPNS